MRMRLSYLLFEQSTELRSGAYRHCIFVGFLTLLRFVCRLPTNVFFHFLFFPLLYGGSNVTMSYPTSQIYGVVGRYNINRRTWVHTHEVHKPPKSPSMTDEKLKTPKISRNPKTRLIAVAE